MKVRVATVAWASCSLLWFLVAIATAFGLGIPLANLAHDCDDTVKIDALPPKEEEMEAPPSPPLCHGRQVVFSGGVDDPSHGDIPKGTIVYNMARNASWMCSNVNRCPCEYIPPHENGGVYDEPYCDYCDGSCLNALKLGHIGGYKEHHESRAIWTGPIHCPIPQYCDPPHDYRGIMWSCNSTL